MEYKYCTDDSFEDFACGRVIYHKTNTPSFPVRLANEIFRRCLVYVGKDSDITLFDPCCGGGYMITVLGLLNSNIIGSIIGSDINEDTTSLAKSNLSLLTREGLLERRQQITRMIQQYNKKSHIDALESTEKFIEIVEQRSFLPEIQCFVADALHHKSLCKFDFKADVIMADIPYGNLVSWSDASGNAVNLLLDTICHVLHIHSVVAISYDRSQKIRNEKYERLERFKAGKRIIEILKLKEVKAKNKI